jgi:hypothetical protein
LLDRMIRLGATNIDSVSFAVKEAAKYEDQVRALAAKDALHRAGITAKALGQRVGRVVKVDRIEPIERVVVTGSRYRQSATGGHTPAVEIMARELTFASNLSVVFELEPATK